MKMSNYLKNVQYLLIVLAICLPICDISGQTETCEYCPDYFDFDSRSLEEAVKTPNDIKSLDISMQKLSAIDPSIGQLKHLECLDLSFNRFSTLPEEFGELENLKCLMLTGCRFLTGVPEIVSQLPNLQYLDLRDHPEWTSKQFDAAEEMLPGVKVIRD